MIFRNARVFDGESEVLLEPRNVTIEGDAIRLISSADAISDADAT